MYPRSVGNLHTGFVVVFNFSIVGVWIGISFEIFIRGVISIVILFRKKWLNVVSIVEN